jgi:hypothetical protein
MNQKNKSKQAQSNSKGSGNKNGKKPQKKVVQRQTAPRSASVAAAYATGQVGRAPAIQMKKSSCRIVHRELVLSVFGTKAFTVSKTLQLNPGISDTFPWLSGQAFLWEEYKFHKCDLKYYTRTGSGTSGSLILAPDYDAADAAPTSEQTASSFEDVAEDAVWKNIVCHLRPSSMDGMVKRHYTRSGPLAANLDIKTYDVGNCFVCTVDGTDGDGWGKLWIEYDVEFFVPQLPSGGSPFNNGGRILSGPFGSTTAANPMGTVPVSSQLCKGCHIDGASLLTIDNPGNYLATFDSTGVGLTANSVFAALDPSAGTVTQYLQTINSTGVKEQAKAILTALVPGAQFQLSNVGTSVSASSFDLAQSVVGSFV